MPLVRSQLLSPLRKASPILLWKSTKRWMTSYASNNEVQLQHGVFFQRLLSIIMFTKEDGGATITASQLWILYTCMSLMVILTSKFKWSTYLSVCSSSLSVDGSVTINHCLFVVYFLSISLCFWCQETSYYYTLINSLLHVDARESTSSKGCIGSWEGICLTFRWKIPLFAFVRCVPQDQ